MGNRRPGWSAILVATAVAAVAAAGCQGSSTGRTPLGEEYDPGEDGSLGAEFSKDARLIADIYTWECWDAVNKKHYPGAYAHKVSLEYAPEGLRPLELPAPGTCEYGLDMFPTTAGSAAADLSGLTGDPEWETDGYDGELRDQGLGFWFDDVLGDTHTCGDEGADERLTGGTRLADAGPLTGIGTPLPAPIPEISYEGFETVVDWGDEVMVTVDDSEWEQVWIQLRRENTLGEPVESVTCNITGQAEFLIDEQVWSLMNADLELHRNNLYVAVQRAETLESSGGDRVDVFTRIIDTAVILD